MLFNMPTSESAPQERYLFKPFFGSSHLFALTHAERLSKDAKVLDIGAGSGAIGAQLKQGGFTNLNAVEIDARARDHIQPIYHRVEDSIQPFQRENAKFDLVLLLDVIEHMPNPKEFLEQVRGLVKENGIAIVSVPNIAHWSVRVPLLFGIFNYTERGLLDKTHLQFFTRRRLHDMVASAGFHLQVEGCSIPPAEFVLPKSVTETEIFKTVSKIRHAAAQIVPGLFGYQHLAILRPKM